MCSCVRMNLIMFVSNRACFILISKHTGLQYYSFSHLTPWKFGEFGWENKTKHYRVLIQQKLCSASLAVAWKRHTPFLFYRPINKVNGETIQPNYISCGTPQQQYILVLPENWNLCGSFTFSFHQSFSLYC